MMYQHSRIVEATDRPDLLAALNNYCNENVQMDRQLTKKSVALTIPVIKDILDYIHKMDSRFKNVMVCVGSYWQGLKIDKADEFDVSVPLNIPEKFEWVRAQDRQVTTSPSSTKTARDILLSHMPRNPPFHHSFTARAFKRDNSTQKEEIVKIIGARAGRRLSIREMVSASTPKTHSWSPFLDMLRSDKALQETIRRGQTILSPQIGAMLSGSQASFNQPRRVSNTWKIQKIPGCCITNSQTQQQLQFLSQVVGTDAGFVTCSYLNPADPVWRNATDLMQDGFVMPSEVKTRFKMLLSLAVQHLSLKGTVHVSPHQYGPAVTIELNIPGHHPVSVDFAPVVETRLSFEACNCWPRASAKWPSQEKIAAIRNIGINIVAKSDTNWFLSFAECEKELVKDVDKDGGCRKKCHRIMKSLTLDLWCPGEKPILSSYMLKNIWFWECERYPQRKDWDRTKLWTRFMGLIESLLQALSQRHLEVYFYPSVNLLKDKDPTELSRVIGNIVTFLNNPKHFLLGKHKI